GDTLIDPTADYVDGAPIPFTITMYDVEGAPAYYASGTQIVAQVESGDFYQANGAGFDSLGREGAFTIPRLDTTLTLYYKGTKAGTWELVVAKAAIEDVRQDIRIVAGAPDMNRTQWHLSTRGATSTDTVSVTAYLFDRFDNPVDQPYTGDSSLVAGLISVDLTDTTTFSRGDVVPGMILLTQSTDTLNKFEADFNLLGIGPMCSQANEWKLLPMVMCRATLALGRRHELGPAMSIPRLETGTDTSAFSRVALVDTSKLQFADPAFYRTAMVSFTPGMVTGMQSIVVPDTFNLDYDAGTITDATTGRRYAQRAIVQGLESLSVYTILSSNGLVVSSSDTLLSLQGAVQVALQSGSLSPDSTAEPISRLATPLPMAATPLISSQVLGGSFGALKSTYGVKDTLGVDVTILGGAATAMSLAKDTVWTAAVEDSLRFTLTDAYGNIAPVDTTASLKIETTAGPIAGYYPSHDDGDLDGRETRSFTAGKLNVPATFYKAEDSVQVWASFYQGVDNFTSGFLSDTLMLAVDPGVASLDSSFVSVAADSITADGAATVLVTAQLVDSLGNYLSKGGANVALNTDQGTLLDKTIDNTNGTYTRTLRSTTSLVTANVTGLLEGRLMPQD
ncbi:MAG: hypothetical protein EB075_11665, partial [Bacteroidetes bacterium]|nr:hypothetical protein [Bacteroidota bacterium]